MNDSLYIAVDLGAGSGRVFLAGVAPGELLLEEIRRFEYPARRSADHLRWNLSYIVDEIKAGLCEAGARAREIGRPIQSVGVDSWGVDYGLVDSDGGLLEEPVCYRDERTQDVMEQVFARIPRHLIFERTGIQFLVFNTLFQLYAHAQTGIPNAAARLLLIPDLINLKLTGRAVTEYTNATTTQMINAQTRTWDAEIMESLGLPAALFAEIVPAGTVLGPLKPALADELSLHGAQIVATATHDTASAVAGAPLEDGSAYISSGTWSLVGVERDSPLITPEVARHNFTNEGGAFRRFRFLKNVMGLWILEACRKEWKERGLEVDYDRLLRQVEEIEGSQGLIFADDPRFFNPPSMLAAISEQMNEGGQRPPAAPPAVAKVILDSLAFRYASIVRIIEQLTHTRIKRVHIVGGGSRNDYLNQMTAGATGLPTLAGPVEATVIGNVLVQAIAANRFASLAEARRHVAENVRLKEFTPRRLPALEEAAARYTEIEARYVN
ncbi:MAG TPA: rhamnulokinase family protein [Blastocatellia bacterium]|nr:rhamnulokinase family protein [Blastocatellia bacterium]